MRLDPRRDKSPYEYDGEFFKNILLFIIVVFLAIALSG